MGSSIKKVRKIFWKSDLSYALIQTRSCVYHGVRNVSFFGKFCERTKWMIPKNRPIVLSKLTFLTLWKFNYMIKCKKLIFLCQSIESMLIKFQMETTSLNESITKSLISIWQHKSWRYLIFLFFIFYFTEILLKISFYGAGKRERNENHEQINFKCPLTAFAFICRGILTIQR